MATTLVRIQLLSKTSTDFSTTNPVLLDGEMGIANAGSAVPVMKVGDGVRPWSALPDIVAAGAGADYVAGPVNTLPPGSPATVVIDNTVSPPTISFGIPAGVQGDVGSVGPIGPIGPIGPAGPANVLTIGTVTTGAPGSAAGATITGTPPAQVLNLAIPQGIQGPVGGIGPAGPANSLSIGTVTTGAPGSAADATISGTPPTQVLSLTIPQGPQGIQGIQGIQGNPGTPGSGAPANPTASVGLTAVNGVALTYLRSDGAPALNQAISPTWTGDHTFTGTVFSLQFALPRVRFVETDATANNKTWGIGVNGEAMELAVFDDGLTAKTIFMVINRTAQVIDSIDFTATALRWNANSLVTVASSPTWTGSHTFASTGRAFTVQSATPDMYFDETDAAANERLWRTVVSGGTLFYGTRTDADTAGANWMQVDRTGTVVDSVTFPARTMFTVSSTGTNGDGAVALAAAVPCLTWRETIAAVDNRTWLAYASGEQFRLATINDANNTAVNFMVVDRTGTTIDEIALNGTRISVNGSLWTPAQVNFTAGAAGFIEFVNRSAGALGFKWYTGANASLNPMTLGSAGNLTVTGWFNSSAGVSSIGTQYIGWGVAPSTSYGSCYVTGTGGGYHGITVYDGAVNLCMMGNAVTAGLYSQGDANWVIYRQNGTNVGCGFTFNANAFNATSSRKIKRETGKPTRAADILSKLRPILYRLLKDESREQLGLIAEEVHDVCPQMSDGKTISYDRLAILLLTDWQESRGLALN